MRPLFLFSVLFSMLLPASAWAFGSTGHQQICQLAYQQAAKTTQQQIDALLQLKAGETFAKGISGHNQSLISGPVRRPSINSINLIQ